MRSLSTCVGCGDLLYTAAPANWRDQHQALEGLHFCRDGRRAECVPRIACVRAAAHSDLRFAALLEALERNQLKTRERWQKLQRVLPAVASILLVLLPVARKATKPPRGPSCSQKDPGACGGSPSRCDCSSGECRCVVRVSATTPRK